MEEMESRDQMPKAISTRELISNRIGLVVEGEGKLMGAEEVLHELEQNASKHSKPLRILEMQVREEYFM
jgi:hypothetical protein